MKRYHTNFEGDPGECEATQKCPFGWPLDQHAKSPLEASRRWEQMKAEKSTPAPLKKAAVGKRYPRNTINASSLKTGMVFVRPRDESGTVYRVLSDADPQRGRVKTDKGVIGFKPENKLLLVNAPKEYDYNRLPSTTNVAPVTPSDAIIRDSYEQGGPTPTPARITALQARKHAAKVLDSVEGKNVVLATKEPQPNVVELKVSSWYNAIQLNKSFNDLGFHSEMGKTPNGKGQWVRVQPKPEANKVTETTSFDWEQDSNSFVAEASTLGKAPRYIKSVRTGEIVEMQKPQPIYNGVGQLESWLLEPVSPLHRWSVKIVNT